MMYRNNKISGKGDMRLIWLIAGSTMGIALPLAAAVLPEERIDALFHSYDGGGITINGPSLLARKQINNNTSVSASYYVDSITSASIDVVTSASPYKEKRTEHSISANYLHNKSTLSAGYINSEENDFEAKSYHFNVSQDLFGDLTTLSMGYSRGKDNIFKTRKLSDGMKVRDTSFSENADRQNFRLSVTQILSKSLIANINYELITDKGYLNNPYRSVIYSDNSKTSEDYPHTRSSNAVSFNANYYLPYRAALHGTVGVFSDTWGIQAYNYELSYLHPLENNWILGTHYRAYSQTQANFYRDIFDPLTTYTYMASDKELSTFSNWTFGLEASYEFKTEGWGFVDKGSLNIKYDYINFEYDNFSNLDGGYTGNNPLYAFSAKVFQAYLSLWY